MSAVEWLLWAAIVWAVFLTYAAVDVPTLVGRLYTLTIRKDGR